MSEEKNKRFDPREVERIKDPDGLLKALHDDPEIRFVRLMFPDLWGNIDLNATVPVYRFNEKTFTEGIGFDGSSVLGMSRIKESDHNMRPEASTAMILPWTYEGKTPGLSWKEMVVFVDILTPEGKPHQGDTRGVLKRTLAKTQTEIGADTAYFGPELEFFLFEAGKHGMPALNNENGPILVDSGQYFKGGRYGEVRKEVQLLMQAMGYEFEYDHHEVSESQHEIDVKYLPAIEMADFVMLYKYMVRRVAREYRLFASFMPKPIMGQNGNGMHTHQSLFKDGKNMFFSRRDRFGLSKKGKQYMAGLMTHMRDITAFLNPWENSYKRLVPGFEAPVYICWDPSNRSNLIRIPGYQPGNQNATRIELRSADPSCNPYLAFATMLGAGTSGIVNELKAPKPTDANVYEMSESEMKQLGIESLPGNLEEALNLAEHSTLVRDTLGQHLLDAFLTDRRAHLADYNADAGSIPRNQDLRQIITKYEREHLLPIL